MQLVFMFRWLNILLTEKYFLYLQCDSEGDDDKVSKFQIIKTICGKSDPVNIFYWPRLKVIRILFHCFLLTKNIFLYKS